MKAPEGNSSVPEVNPPKDADLGKFRCVCDPGFEGDDCGTAVCVNRCTDLKHGTCVNGTCVCATGFDGVDCSIPAANGTGANTHQCIVGCNTKCNQQCGKAVLKGVAFKTKCLQQCMNLCKDGCKVPTSDSTGPGKQSAKRGFALATNSSRPDLLHAQRDGGGPQPNEVRPQPVDEPVDPPSPVPQRSSNGGGPRDGLSSTAAKEANTAKQE